MAFLGKLTSSESIWILKVNLLDKLAFHLIKVIRQFSMPLNVIRNIKLKTKMDLEHSLSYPIEYKTLYSEKYLNSRLSAPKIF